MEGTLLHLSLTDMGEVSQKLAAILKGSIFCANHVFVRILLSCQAPIN